jgi:hypothetical protein
MVVSEGKNAVMIKMIRLYYLFSLLIATNPKTYLNQQFRHLCARVFGAAHWLRHHDRVCDSGGGTVDTARGEDVVEYVFL